MRRFMICLSALLVGCFPPVRVQTWKPASGSGVIVTALVANYYATGPDQSQVENFQTRAEELCQSRYVVDEEGMFDTGNSSDVDWAQVYGLGKSSPSMVGLTQTIKERGYYWKFHCEAR